jgi:hypothetical protein
VFRRRSADAPQVLESDQPVEDETSAEPERASLTPAKGRPTPKRSEAERRRRQPYSAPSDRKTAGKQSRDRDRSTRDRQMEAMKRGEAWALPRKHQGAVKALARDYVDSHRSFSEFYMFAAVPIVVLLFIPKLHNSPVVVYIVLAIAAVIAAESMTASNRVKKLAKERFPGESTQGLWRYVAARNLQLRGLRMPSPRVKPGDKI